MAARHGAAALQSQHSGDWEEEIENMRSTWAHSEWHCVSNKWKQNRPQRLIQIHEHIINLTKQIFLSWVLRTIMYCKLIRPLASKAPMIIWVKTIHSNNTQSSYNAMYSLRKSIKIYYFNSFLNNKVPTSLLLSILILSSMHVAKVK